MKQNEEVTTLNVCVKKENQYDKTTAPSIPELFSTNVQAENICSYMGIIALEAFVAELFVLHIAYSNEFDFNSNLTKTIENAIWALNMGIGFDESIEGVKFQVHEMGIEMTEADIFLLRLIGYSNERQSMGFYFRMVKELTEQHEWDLLQEEILPKRVTELKSKGAENALREGRVAFNPDTPKPANPYIENELREAWYIGYELQRIEQLWKRSVNGFTTE